MSPVVRQELARRAQAAPCAIGAWLERAVDDVAAAGAQRVGHRVFRAGDVDRVPVVLEIIDAPRGPLRGVVAREGHGAQAAPRRLAAVFGLVVSLREMENRIVAAAGDPLGRTPGIVGRAADEAGVGGGPRRGIDAELEPEGVHLPGEPLEVGEFRVGLDGVVIAAARALPAVVDVDVGPAVLVELLVDEGVRGAQDLVLADGAAPAVPAIPAHRRGERDLVADDDAERLLVLAGGVGGMERDLVLARRGDGAGDAAGRGIELQTGGQAVRGEGYRPVAGRGDGIEKGLAGAFAVDLRAGDLRRGTRRGGEDSELAGVRGGRRLDRGTGGEERKRSRREGENGEGEGVGEGGHGGKMDDLSI